MTVHYGILENFQLETTLLFLADSQSLVQFASFLRQPGKTRTVLDEKHGFMPHGMEPVILQGTSLLGSTVSGGKTGQLTWSISEKDSEDFADMLLVLSQADHGHQYLDSAGSLQVIVSLNEYEASIFETP